MVQRDLYMTSFNQNYLSDNPQLNKLTPAFHTQDKCNRHTTRRREPTQQPSSRITLKCSCSFLRFFKTLFSKTALDWENDTEFPYIPSTCTESVSVKHEHSAFGTMNELTFYIIVNWNLAFIQNSSVAPWRAFLSQDPSRTTLRSAVMPARAPQAGTAPQASLSWWPQRLHSILVRCAVSCPLTGVWCFPCG